MEQHMQNFETFTALVSEMSQPEFSIPRQAKHLSVMMPDLGTGNALTKYMEQLATSWAWAWVYMFIGPFQWMTDAFFCAPLDKSIAPVSGNGCMWSSNFFDVNFNYFMFMTAQFLYLPLNIIQLFLVLFVFMFQQFLTLFP